MSQRREYMDAAWEISRKLINLTSDEREEIFGYSDIGRIIKNNSCDKTWFKILEYEKKFLKLLYVMENLKHFQEMN